MKRAWNMKCGRPANCDCAALSLSLVIVLLSFNVQALAQDVNPGRIVAYTGQGFIMFNTDGTNVINLTENAGEHAAPVPPFERGSDDYHPSVSRDGKVAFQSAHYTFDGTHGTGSRIYVMHPDGRIKHLTTIEGLHIDAGSGMYPDDTNPVISSDGSKVCFIGRRNEAETSPGVFYHPWTDVYVVNTDGTGLHQVTQSQYRAGSGANYSSILSCAWNPDGSKIAFKGLRLRTDPDGQPHFHAVLGTINPDGTGETHIPVINDINWLGSSGYFSEQALDWSPDGRYILVEYGGGAMGSPYPRYLILDLTGGGVGEIPGPLSANAGSARFSPDSERIVYVTDNPSFTAGYPTFINRDGTNKSVLTSLQLPRFAPLWWMPGAGIPAPSRLELTPNPVRIFQGGPAAYVTPTLYDADDSVIVHGVRSLRIDPYYLGSPAVSCYSGAVVARDTTVVGTFTLTATNAGLTANTTVVVALPVLTVDEAGTGDGTVSAHTGTLSCSGTTCTGTYAYNSPVTLTAAPSAGSSFGSWQGCDSVSGNECTVAMDDDITVEATFLDTSAPIGGTLVPTVGVGQITLQWGGFTDAVSGVERYRLVFALNGMPGSCSGGTFLYEGADTSYIHQGLPAGTTVYYRVCAYDRADNGSAVTAQATSLSTCTYQIAPTTQSVDAPGGSGTVTVTTQTGCAWTAVSSDSWITITSGAGSSGSGAVGYQVAENISGGPRAGTITIGVQTLEIQQSDVETHQEILALDTKYYNDVLDRAPEPGGAEWWTAEVERIVTRGIDIREGFQALGKVFFNSTEYNLPTKSPNDFVTDLYQTFLNRQPDKEGKDHWMGRLQEGLTPNMLITEFANCEEFKLFLQDILGTMSTRPENNLVNDLYRGFLGRLPDSAGFNHWLKDNPAMNMRSAQCSGAAAVRNLTYQIALAFIQSNEYTNRQRNNNQYVEDLYNGILKRGADPTGYMHWVNLLKTYTRQQMLRFFTESPEFQTRVQAVIDAGCLP